MKRWIFNAFLLSFAWIFVRGSADPSSVAIGVLLAFPISYAFRNAFEREVDVSGLALKYVLVYLYSFIRDLVASNLDVAVRVLKPSKPTNPGIISYGSELENSAAVTVLANSITLTPGTLVVDCSENHELKVHCIDVSEAEEVIEGIREWEKILMKMTGEEK